jgi:protein-S-isoprenylcysteine O-methyltransferase Ste14
MCRRGYPSIGEDLEGACICAGDTPCHGEERRRASASDDARHSAIHRAMPLAHAAQRQRHHGHADHDRSPDRPVDDSRQSEDRKGQERKGRWHGMQTWTTTLPYTRLSQHAAACYAHGAISAGEGDRMTPDGRPLPQSRSFPRVRPIVRVTLVLGGTTAYLGLAILGRGGWTAFCAHPALVALAVTLAILAGVSLCADGNLSPGVREDRGNRWVIGALTLLGLLAAYLPAYTDRQAFWTIDGEPLCWLGVVLFAAGGALRLWPVFVLGRRFSGLVAIQPGHTLVTSGVYRVIRHPSYLGLLVNALGWGVAFHAGVGVLLTALMIPPILARIHAEERLLRTQFGSEYGAYCARTSRLLPGLYERGERMRLLILGFFA